MPVIERMFQSRNEPDALPALSPSPSLLETGTVGESHHQGKRTVQVILIPKPEHQHPLERPLLQHTRLASYLLGMRRAATWAANCSKMFKKEREKGEEQRRERWTDTQVFR